MRLLVILKKKFSDYEINEFIVLLCSECRCLQRMWRGGGCEDNSLVTWNGSHWSMKEDSPIFWVIKSPVSELEGKRGGHSNCLPSCSRVVFASESKIEGCAANQSLLGFSLIPEPDPFEYSFLPVLAICCQFLCSWFSVSIHFLISVSILWEEQRAFIRGW